MQGSTPELEVGLKDTLSTLMGNWDLLRTRHHAISISTAIAEFQPKITLAAMYYSIEKKLCFQVSYQSQFGSDEESSKY